MIEFIGSLAGILTTVSFFPQVLKTIKSKSAGDFSTAWIVMMTTGVFFWMIYGYYISSIPVFLANVVTLGCMSILTWIKFFGSKDDQSVSNQSDGVGNSERSN
ncbi:SemiSWEET family sugar transporter [Sporomusa malonica]|uniref:MtN3 and saliva related transmembrane protein n=1 Tax=Sporomusa malonica TaxID=112901 RepID=A0A1W2CBR9_9FIRM|nr:SemiSWEET transporter [Sporomusa malonica]SMC82620.1 MtN3 and saliva related transmembrane protein [Sporomusa malonica]